MEEFYNFWGGKSNSKLWGSFRRRFFLGGGLKIFLDKKIEKIEKIENIENIENGMLEEEWTVEHAEYAEGLDVNGHEFRQREGVETPGVVLERFTAHSWII